MTTQIHHPSRYAVMIFRDLRDVSRFRLYDAARDVTETLDASQVFERLIQLRAENPDLRIYASSTVQSAVGLQA